MKPQQFSQDTSTSSDTPSKREFSCPQSLGKAVNKVRKTLPKSPTKRRAVAKKLLRPGADQSSKAAFCKSAFAKSKLTFDKSAFAQSRFAFRQSIFASQKAMVWPSATSKMLSPKTCQNVLESIFARLLCSMSYL